MKPNFLNPAKEPTSVSESESIANIPSPVTSPVLSRRHYGESITNIGKASILGNFSCFLSMSVSTEVGGGWKSAVRKFPTVQASLLTEPEAVMSSSYIKEQETATFCPSL